MYSEWTVTVDDIAQTNLEKPLLVRADDSSQLSVNFDPEVCEVIIATVDQCITCAMYMYKQYG